MFDQSREKRHYRKCAHLEEETGRCAESAHYIVILLWGLVRVVVPRHLRFPILFAVAVISGFTFAGEVGSLLSFLGLRNTEVAEPVRKAKEERRAWQAAVGNVPPAGDGGDPATGVAVLKCDASKKGASAQGAAQEKCEAEPSDLNVEQQQYGISPPVTDAVPSYPKKRECTENGIKYRPSAKKLGWKWLPVREFPWPQAKRLWRLWPNGIIVHGTGRMVYFDDPGTGRVPWVEICFADLKIGWVAEYYLRRL